MRIAMAIGSIIVMFSCHSHKYEQENEESGPMESFQIIPFQFFLVVYPKQQSSENNIPFLFNKKLLRL